MYIGESEKNVRQVFLKAKECRPCVIFFDELDSVAPKRGGKGDSGGVMDRIVSQLLAELDNIDEKVFVVGATNRPDLLDTALLRPGRFEKLLYLGVSDTTESQLFILKSLTRKLDLEPGLDLEQVAEKCPFIYSGADFYALCADAQLQAIFRKISQVEQDLQELNHLHRMQGKKELSAQEYLELDASSDSQRVQVTFSDFMRALEQLEPSISPKELQRYEELKRQYQT